MVEFEAAHLRERTIKTTSGADFDSSLKFYYDETNNFRKFHIKKAKFNSSFTSNFVLGGLVHECPQLEIKKLFDGLKIQNNVKEVKFSYVAKGDFINCLRSRNLAYFLEYLLNSGAYIHLSSFNFLYWSVVDIVDSAIPNYSVHIESLVADDLKDVLYQVIKNESETAVQIFYQFNYPNLKEHDIPDFISSLLLLIEKYSDRKDLSLGLWLLKNILKSAKKNQSLPLLTDNEDHILLENFIDFYLRPIYIFKHSTHIFDHEATIVEIIKNYKISDRSEKIKNYSFVDSKTNLYVQASDVLVGLMGKFETYRNSSSEDTIRDDFNSLSRGQLDTANLFFDLIAKSREKNVGFLFSLDSRRERMKMDLIENLRTKKPLRKI